MPNFWKRTVALTLVTALLTSSASALTSEEVLELLDTYYLDAVPAASREMETAEEILASLGDPYTVYMPATDYEAFLESVDGGSVEGIGVMIHQVQDKGVEIISVLPDSPALEAGVTSGDVVTAVNGITVLSLDHAQEMIAGASGTELEISFQRADGTTFTATMTRRMVDIPIVTYESIDGVTFITCSSFGDTTADVVREALESDLNSDTPFILDLQRNPGGTDTAAAGAAGWFIGGATICYYLDNQGHLSRLYTYDNTPDFTDQPLIILTSGYSASGSEMFSTAIRAYDGGISIGSRTYGKGIAQRVLDEDSHPELFDGDSVKITTSRFYAADGGTNDTVGVIPTLVIDSTYVEAVALLLSAPQPESPDGFLKLELGGSTFYVDVEKAMEEDNLPAFQELLESIAVTQPAYYGTEGMWLNLGGEVIADLLDVPYVSRSYTDAATSPYVNQLSFMATHYILPFEEDGSLGTTQTMTRGDFAYMVACALQLRVVEHNPFADVADEDENRQAISALYAKGLIHGDESGLFRPDDLITHQEAVTILANAAQWLNLDARSAANAGFDQETLSGYTGYASWAQPSAATLDAIGARFTDTTPTTVQRDEAGAMIYELLESANLLWN